MTDMGNEGLPNVPELLVFLAEDEAPIQEPASRCSFGSSLVSRALRGLSRAGHGIRLSQSLDVWELAPLVCEIDHRAGATADRRFPASQHGRAVRLDGFARHRCPRGRSVP